VRNMTGAKFSDNNVKLCLDHGLFLHWESWLEKISAIFDISPILPGLLCVELPKELGVA
jgi:hypothetical protein